MAVNFGVEAAPCIDWRALSHGILGFSLLEVLRNKGVNATSNDYVIINLLEPQIDEGGK